MSDKGKQDAYDRGYRAGAQGDKKSLIEDVFDWMNSEEADAYDKGREDGNKKWEEDKDED